MFESAMFETALFEDSLLSSYTLDYVLKISFRFQATSCALRCPGYDKTLLFCSIMSVEYANPNLKSAQLGQPAPKLELDLYIPQT